MGTNVIPSPITVLPIKMIAPTARYLLASLCILLAAASARINYNARRRGQRIINRLNGIPRRTMRIRMGEYEGHDIHGVQAVVSAKFGANSTWLDVTNRVNYKLNGASLNFSCYYLNSGKSMWKDLGGPLPGQPKELIIEYIPATQRTSNGIFGQQVKPCTADRSSSRSFELLYI